MLKSSGNIYFLLLMKVAGRGFQTPCNLHVGSCRPSLAEGKQKPQDTAPWGQTAQTQQMLRAECSKTGCSIKPLLAGSDHGRDESQQAYCLGRVEIKQRGKTKPINCGLIVHSSFLFSRTRSIASLCAYMQAYAYICINTHPLQLETLQIAGSKHI